MRLKKKNVSSETFSNELSSKALGETPNRCSHIGGYGILNIHKSYFIVEFSIREFATLSRPVDRAFRSIEGTLLSALDCFLAVRDGPQRLRLGAV